MSIWSLAVGRGQITKAAQDTQAVAQQAQDIATRGRQAFNAVQDR